MSGEIQAIADTILGNTYNVNLLTPRGAKRLPIIFLSSFLASLASWRLLK
jgi:hypothetical protein